MIYPQKLNSKKSEIIWKISILISVLVALFLIAINMLATPKVHWSALVIGGIIYTWITVYYSIKRNVNIAGHVVLQTIAISLLTIFIDYNLKFKGWSIDIAIPIVIMIANITMFVLTIVSHKKFIKYAIYQLIILLISTFPVIFISENIVHNKVLSIIASIISGINFIVSLILCSKDIKEVIIRKFHL